MMQFFVLEKSIFFFFFLGNKIPFPFFLTQIQTQIFHLYIYIYSSKSFIQNSISLFQKPAVNQIEIELTHKNYYSYTIFQNIPL